MVSAKVFLVELVSSLGFGLNVRSKCSLNVTCIFDKSLIQGSKTLPCKRSAEGLWPSGLL